MKKDLLNLASFFLNNYDNCRYNNQELFITKDDLSIKINSDITSPEYVRLTLLELNNNDDFYGKKMYFKEIASQIILTEKAENVILNIWKEIEINKNQEFINKYGIEKYHIYYDSCMSALNGQKEDDLFNFIVESNNTEIQIYIKEKTNENDSKMSCFSEIPINTYKNNYLIHSTIHIPLMLPIKDKHSKKNNYGEFTIFMPIINLKDNIFLKNLLKIETHVRFEDENIFSYCQSKLKNDRSIKLLNAFELQNDLNVNNNQIKKLKL